MSVCWGFVLMGVSVWLGSLFGYLLRLAYTKYSGNESDENKDCSNTSAICPEERVFEYDCSSSEKYQDDYSNSNASYTKETHSYLTVRSDEEGLFKSSLVSLLRRLRCLND